MTIANTNTEYRDLPLSVLTESKTNPRRFFEDSALKTDVEKIAVGAVGFFDADRHSDAVGLGVVDQIGAAFEFPIAPWATASAFSSRAMSTIRLAMSGRAMLVPRKYWFS